MISCCEPGGGHDGNFIFSSIFLPEQVVPLVSSVPLPTKSEVLILMPKPGVSKNTAYVGVSSGRRAMRTGYLPVKTPWPSQLTSLVVTDLLLTGSNRQYVSS